MPDQTPQAPQDLPEVAKARESIRIANKRGTWESHEQGAADAWDAAFACEAAGEDAQALVWRDIAQQHDEIAYQLGPKAKEEPPEDLGGGWSASVLR